MSILSKMLSKNKEPKGAYETPTAPANPVVANFNATNATNTTNATNATNATTVPNSCVNVEYENVILGSPQWFEGVKDKFTLTHSDDLSIFYVKLNNEIIVALDRDEKFNKFNMENYIGKEIDDAHYRWDFNKKNGGKRISMIILDTIYSELDNFLVPESIINIEVKFLLKKSE